MCAARDNINASVAHLLSNAAQHRAPQLRIRLLEQCKNHLSLARADQRILDCLDNILVHAQAPTHTDVRNHRPDTLLDEIIDFSHFVTIFSANSAFAIHQITATLEEYLLKINLAHVKCVVALKNTCKAAYSLLPNPRCVSPAFSFPDGQAATLSQFSMNNTFPPDVRIHFLPKICIAGFLIVQAEANNTSITQPNSPLGYCAFFALVGGIYAWGLHRPVSYTHLTLPTIYSV